MYYATDGHCTHEKTLLCDGLVMGGIIECPAGFVVEPESGALPATEPVIGIDLGLALRGAIA